MKENKILIEGYSKDEILSFDDEKIDEYIFINEPVVFQIGTAKVLGKFHKDDTFLKIELAKIEGGGEGVLSALWGLVDKYTKKNRICQIEWIVHAVNCIDPNHKLRRVLEKKGFKIREIKDFGKAYYLKINIYY